MKKVLIISEINQGYYYKPFLESCNEEDLDIFVFDPSLFPRQLSINLKLSKGGEVSGWLDAVKHSADGEVIHRLEINEIDIAWYLREGFYRKNLDSLDVAKRFSENESRGAFRILLSSLNCKWVNNKETMDYIESNKFYQQIVASRCGLMVPETLVSSSPESVVNFSEKHNGLLLKSIGYVNLDKNNEYFLYANTYDTDEIVDGKESIIECPVFAQEYIGKLCEHRVMVIGDNVLSCKIDSQASEKTKIDWRHYDIENVSHTKSILPMEIQLKLLQFMKCISLSYGAIDMIETKEGDYIFLEVNPSGQWGWIADLAELPIPDAVKEMLLKI